MQLFNATITSSTRSWDHRIRHNPGPATKERQELLDWAMVSPDVHRLLAADMLLYDFAVMIFQAQTTEVLGISWDD